MNRTFVSAAFLAAALLAGATGVPPARAQEAAEPVKPAPCSSPEYRQFDFWIGRWEVTVPNGGVAGTNVIERIEGGCGLRERWEGTRGVTGTSLNIWNARDGRWHQTWIDNTGTLLRLDGGLVDGSMVMTGTTKSATVEGGTTLQRITWTPNADGTVRQLWEASGDDGKTWSVAFDGLYTRMK